MESADQGYMMSREVDGARQFADCTILQDLLDRYLCNVPRYRPFCPIWDGLFGCGSASFVCVRAPE